MGSGGRVDDEIRQMRQGVRGRLAELARRTGATAELASGPAVLGLLCSGALAPVVVAGFGAGGGVLAASAGVLGSVGAEFLSDLVEGAVGSLRRRHPDGGGVAEEEVRRVLAGAIEQALDVDDDTAQGLRRDITRVLTEIHATEVIIEDAIVRGDAEVCLYIAQGFADVSAELGETRALLHELSTGLAALQVKMQSSDAERDLLRHVLVELRLIRQGLAGAPASGRRGGRGDGTRAEAPYRGLAPFKEEHEDIYFGRERVTASLVGKVAERLTPPSIVLVTGASGVGKSSLLRAGLLPELARGSLAVPGSDNWPRLPMIPSARPLEELAGRLAALGGVDRTAILRDLGDRPDQAHVVVRQVLLAVAAPSDDEGRLVLVVDQFEQLFAPDVESGDIGTFIAALLAMATTIGPQAHPPAVVVLGVRSDHLEHCAADPRLAAVLQDGQFIVGPMQEAELRDTITGPADVAGLEIEPGLVDTILNDLRSPAAIGGFDVASLPLLSQAMLTTWENREGPQLTRRGYRASGGVTQAVTNSAKAAYDSLTEAQRGLARQLFTRLAAVGESTVLARRRVPVTELSADLSGDERNDFDAILVEFTRRRLLVRDGEFVEIAHDTLFEAWPQLHDWLEDNRQARVRFSRLVERAAVWDDESRDPSYLYRGAELAGAEETIDVLGDTVVVEGRTREFLRASTQAARRGRRTTGVAMAVGVGVVGLALLLGSLFVYQRGRTRSEADAALSRSLAELSDDIAETDPELSILLALAAYQRNPTGEAEQALFARYGAYGQPHIDAILSGATAAITEAEASHDGRIIAGVEDNGNVVVWNRRPGHQVRMRRLQLEVADEIDLSDDGRHLLVQELTGTRYYDLATGAPLWEIPRDGVADSALRDDGSVARFIRSLEPRSNRLELWAPPDGPRGDPRLVAELPLANDLTHQVIGFGPDPDTVVVRDDSGVLRLWDVDRGLLTPLAHDTTGVAVDDQGTVVSCGQVLDPAERPLDLPGVPPDPSASFLVIDPERGSRREIPLPDEDSGGCPPYIAVSGDGRTMLAGDDAYDLRAEDAVGHHQPQAFGGVGFDDRLVATGDRLLSIALLDSQVALTEVIPDEAWIEEPVVFALTPDGRHFVATNRWGRELVAATASARVIAAVDRSAGVEPEVLDDLAISPDSSLIADRVASGRVHIRRLPGLELVTEVTTTPLDLGPPPVNMGPSVLFHADHLVTVSGTTIEVWNPRTGERSAEFDVAPGNPETGMYVVPHDDPELLAAVVEGSSEVWVIEMATGRRVRTIPVGSRALAIEFQQGSDYFLLLRRDRRIEIWNDETGVELPGPQPNRPLDSSIFWFAQFLSEPGRYIVIDRGQLRWYRAGSGIPERSLEVATNTPYGASADGTVLAIQRSFTEGEDVRGLRTDPEAWESALCRVLGRHRFTPSELVTLPPGVTDDPLC